MFEIFEHTADLGLRARAATLENLFVEAAQALFSVIVANPDSIRPLQIRSYQVQGDELDLLLMDWLNELLYAFETERFLLGDCTIKIDGRTLSATCRGETAVDGRHDLDHEVKAITYHGLSVERIRDGWIAEVIVDI